jgi:opacity protein-like surface antigen
MKASLTRSVRYFAAGSAALAALSSAAFAGDMYNGSPGRLKDYGQAAVPVPAVNSYTEVYQYYFRADAGIGFGIPTPSYTESGMQFGGGDTTTPFSTDRFGGAKSEAAAIHGTFGAGTYISSRFRIDFTADFRQQVGGETKADYSYTANKDAGTASGGAATGFTATGVTVGSTVTGKESDKLTTRSTVLMANAYYDLAERGKFTPYIGLGIGASNNRVERELVFGTETITDPTGTVTTRTGLGAKDAQASWTLAGAAMAGVTYNFDKRTSLDVNYRLQYIQGYDVVSSVWVPGAAAASESRAKVGDLWEHQVRAGLRVNLW